MDGPAHQPIFGYILTWVPANGGAQAIYTENLPEFGYF
jgi:hypothetical protein